MLWWLTTTHIKFALLCRALRGNAINQVPPTAAGEICQRLVQRPRKLAPLRGKHASNGTEPPMTMEKTPRPVRGYWHHVNFKNKPEPGMIPTFWLDPNHWIKPFKGPLYQPAWWIFFKATMLSPPLGGYIVSFKIWMFVASSLAEAKQDWQAQRVKGHHKEFNMG